MADGQATDVPSSVRATDGFVESVNLLLAMDVAGDETARIKVKPLADGIRKAIAEEREACARIAAAHYGATTCDGDGCECNQTIAADIRARQ